MGGLMSREKLKHLLTYHRTGFILTTTLLALVVLYLHSCVSRPSNPFTKARPKDVITIMAYNVENLFDAEHDEGTEDYTYLPLVEKKRNKEAQAYCAKQSKPWQKEECLKLNWDEKQLHAKMSNLSRVILQVYGEGPDILLLEEVENKKILSRLVREYLSSANYHTIELIDGPDPRGIDTAVVSRFPLAGAAKLHMIEWNKAADLVTKPTRGILEVPLKLPSGAIIHVFALHFPSQAAPTPFREDAVATVLKLAEQVPEDHYWVFGGDWNITAEEDENTGLVTKALAQKGLVSHKIGCKNCRGSHNYQRHWSFLDILFFSPKFKEGPLQLDSNSITTPMWAEGQMRISGRPLRYSHEEKTGVSDHLPIYSEIKIISSVVAKDQK
jgi:endonuclease/exonuclease/phosphatase family metal-dependent hydrolase